MGVPLTADECSVSLPSMASVSNRYPPPLTPRRPISRYLRKVPLSNIFSTCQPFCQSRKHEESTQQQYLHLTPIISRTKSLTMNFQTFTMQQGQVVTTVRYGMYHSRTCRNRAWVCITTLRMHNGTCDNSPYCSLLYTLPNSPSP